MQKGKDLQTIFNSKTKAMNSGRFLTLVLILSLFSCTSPKKDDKTSQQVASTNESETPQSSSDSSEFAIFWTGLGEAIEANDTSAIVNYIYFPLQGGQELIGQEEAIEGISKEEFIENFEVIFDQATVEEIQNTVSSEIESSILGLNAGYRVNGMGSKAYDLKVTKAGAENEEKVLIFRMAPVNGEFKIIQLMMKADV